MRKVIFAMTTRPDNGLSRPPLLAHPAKLASRPSPERVHQYAPRGNVRADAAGGPLDRRRSSEGLSEIGQKLSSSDRGSAECDFLDAPAVVRDLELNHHIDRAAE